MKRVLCSVILIAMATFVLPGEIGYVYRDPSAVVRRWSSFEESRVPRPLLLVSPLPAVEKSGGNVTRAGLRTELPDNPTEFSEVVLPDDVATLPHVPARDAFAALQRQLESKAAPGREDMVVGAESIVQRFLSDRGFVSLPAWRFRLAGGGALVWPALPSRYFWRLGSLSPSSVVVKASASRVRPEITVWMDPGHACGQTEPVRPNARITESYDVVVISGASVTRPDFGSSSCVVSAYHRARSYTYELSSPLGDRGLLDELGNVVVVYDGTTATKPELPRPTPTHS
ncbi:MAG: putative secreted protein [Nonomuraea muscovyensis]|nr:putative secreted protein [Nonomuraea muscovyensis]